MLKNFEYSLMELLQRTDRALAIERLRAQPSTLRLVWLKRQRRKLAERLMRSPTLSAMAGA